MTSKARVCKSTIRRLGKFQSCVSVDRDADEKRKGGDCKNTKRYHSVERGVFGASFSAVRE